MCVKCRGDGELPRGRRKGLKEAFRGIRSASRCYTETDKNYLLMRSFKDYCEGGIFYETMENIIYTVLSGVEGS